MLHLSPGQKDVLDKVIVWCKKDKSQSESYITIGGYAGTGKTTLIAILRKRIARLRKDMKVGFVSYTGKAARVLRNKLKEAKVILPDDSVGTIHSLIYSPVVNEREEIIGWKQKEKIDRDLIIIDEASMVDETIWLHLLSYKVPIIVVGDHGQLPPISGSFHLISNPELELVEIHRQAQNNPIIALSIQARQNGYIHPGIYGDFVRKFSKDDTDAQETVSELLANYSPETLILCGYNKTRKKLNLHIRNTLGFTSPLPQVGDRVICLRNNHQKHIFNGMTGTIFTIKDETKEWYMAEIQMDGEDGMYKGLISKDQFMSDAALNFTNKRSAIMAGDLFDFGYALTVHKAQGSQAKRVILFEERFSKMDDEQWKRWLYTGVTRAEEELYIIPQ
ncbi:MAG: ATP-dependent RecD-like DNA helicase [Candidatus Roizmanbacteria bacterium]|nr:ATP-dependent RecD-like DNA helicase [Candidatus Roizmanbacteria bacterium]